MSDNSPHPPKLMREIRSLCKYNSRSEVLRAIKVIEIKYLGFRGGRGYFLLGNGKDDICFEDKNDLGSLGFEKTFKV